MKELFKRWKTMATEMKTIEAKHKRRKRWAIINSTEDRKPHYVAVAGLLNRLPPYYCAVHDTYERAVQDLVALFYLENFEEAELRETASVCLNIYGGGTEYAEIMKCEDLKSSIPFFGLKIKYSF